MTAQILVSVIIVSLVSLVGVIIIAFGDKGGKHEQRKSVLLTFLVALAIGALLGNLFLHLLPEAYEYLGPTAAIWVFAGLLIFFLLEKLLHWRHFHKEKAGKTKSVGVMSLVADGVHNLLDGALIAAAYLISLPVGIATTIAVILHEIPQELGDYGILRSAGFSRFRALAFNLLSGLFAVVGALIVIYWGGAFQNSEPLILSVAAGGFIYLIYLLLTTLGKDMIFSKVAISVVAFVIGLGSILLVSAFGPEHGHVHGEGGHSHSHEHKDHGHDKHDDDHDHEHEDHEEDDHDHDHDEEDHDHEGHDH